MGIYIKDIEMPKDGVYWCEIGVVDDIAMITIHGEERKSFPLIPIPPHGRLIDADELYPIYADLLDSGDVKAVVPKSVIDTSPTIIEAEETI